MRDIDTILKQLFFSDGSISDREIAKTAIDAFYTAKFEACLPEKQPELKVDTYVAGLHDGHNAAIDQTRDNWYKG